MWLNRPLLNTALEGSAARQAARAPRTSGTVMSIFFSMDSMVGEMFEEGLANLKVIAEK
ncbi:MAG: hypothetical protein ACREVY_11395 [Gammaproteobacteria bacterium]